MNLFFDTDWAQPEAWVLASTTVVVVGVAIYTLWSGRDLWW